ncbi:hypothetical protein BRAS3843_2890004 [Bradyrhizobium sp. STM 3843]|nr:hypothetical protein BRAS3843_2890004 [Bradyrhizobium sp. STM 3843]
MQRAGLQRVIPYALRHSSIVRGLRNMLPIQHVSGLGCGTFGFLEPIFGRFLIEFRSASALNSGPFEAFKNRILRDGECVHGLLRCFRPG